MTNFEMKCFEITEYVNGNNFQMKCCEITEYANGKYKDLFCVIYFDANIAAGFVL